MDLDSISECQAKEILDILARKAGYHCVYISIYGRLLIEAGSTTSPICIDDFDQDCINVNKQDLGCQDIYRNCLSKVLAVSADGKDLVFIELQGISVVKRIFLPKDTSLEQILIWLDLEGKNV